MSDRIIGSESKIKGLDFIHNLLNENELKELNQGYSELLISLNGRKNNSIDDELAEALKEFGAMGMKYSTSRLLKGKNIYFRFIFRESFVIFFPFRIGDSIMVCKYKHKTIIVKNAGEADNGMHFLSRMKLPEIKRKAIEDEDFFEFERILKKLSEKIKNINAARKAAFYKFERESRLHSKNCFRRRYFV